MKLPAFTQWLAHIQQRCATSIAHDLCHKLAHQIGDEKRPRSVRKNRWKLETLLKWGADPESPIADFQPGRVSSALYFDLNNYQLWVHSGKGPETISYPVGLTIREFAASLSVPAWADVFLHADIQKKNEQNLFKMIGFFDDFENRVPGLDKPTWHKQKRAEIESFILKIHAPDAASASPAQRRL